MKKILLMTFVSMAMLAAVSCSKDDEKDNTDNTISLVGTSWQCVHSFSVPVLGSVTLTADLSFTTGETCHIDLTLPSSIASLVPFDLNGDYAYSISGNKVIIDADNNMLGEMELEYVNGTMLIWTVPENYRSTLGTSELIFHKK